VKQQILCEGSYASFQVATANRTDPIQPAKAARGTLYLTIQQLIQYFAAFIFYAGVARSITQAKVGLWSILTASTAVFTTIKLVGPPVATQKHISENYGRGDLELHTN